MSRETVYALLLSGVILSYRVCRKKREKREIEAIQNKKFSQNREI